MQGFLGNGSPRGPQQPINLQDLNLPGLTRLVKWGLVVLGIILLLVFLNWARSFYTDWLWYSNLGYQDVLLTVITTRVWLFLGGALAFVVVAIPNLYLVYRLTRGEPPPAMIIVTPELYQTARRLLAWLIVGAVLLVSLGFAVAVAAQWDLILRFANAVPFGVSDPVLDRDVGFYVFTLPLLQFIRGWLLGAVLVVIFMVASLYFLVYGTQGRDTEIPRSVKAHVAGLGVAIFLLLAAGHWLGRFELLYSTMGTVFGVGYADATAALPARAVLTGVALLSSAMLVAGVFFSGYRLMIGAVALWVGLAVLGGTVYPNAVQRLQVVPSELAKERPYLADNINFTRQAYGLESLESRAHPAVGIVEADTVAQNQGTVKNIRLWDEGPLLDIYNQVQFFRLYYDFLDVTADRYDIEGELRQVMLSARELSAEKLPGEAQRWVNRRLQFTHGYGVASSPVNEVAPDGRPAFFVKDVPPLGEPPIQRPEIYYGMKSLNFVIARSRMEEFNYPGQDGPVYNKYDGTGGVPLSSFFRRVLYTWQFGDVNVLISGEVEPDSRIQYRRTVPERFFTITPFLVPDQDPYVVIADGRLFWIQDGYTVTDRYPYSTPSEGQFNYMRNSVKAVVDAYHGTIDYYIADPTDPIIQTYASIFPTLFKPMEEMPDYLKPHIRYPRDFFAVQAQMLLQYHMEDPGVFYNKEDQWSIPVQSSFGSTNVPLDPYYIVARLPGEEQEEFLLIQPFTPADRHNLIAWMAARNDPLHYGEMVLFLFPSGRHIDGPNQVEARIDNDVVISEQFTLWGQVGSEVSRGIVLVIPVGDAILYAEPVFLKPETLDFPELRRIILADSAKVVMQPILEDSIRALVGEIPAVTPPVEEDGALVEEPGPLGLEGLEAVAAGLEKAIEELQKALEGLQGLFQGDEEASPSS